MQVDSCRLCGHGRTEVSLRLPGAPRDIQHLLRADQLAADKPVNVEVRACAACGFVQINPLLDEGYYDDYLMGTTHSAQMQQYQSRQAREFIARFQLAGKRVLEAGCGDGSFCEHLRENGAVVFGIEPSRKFRELASARGLDVEEGYLNAGRRLVNGPFDAFVTRQVLEHVPDIHDFLTGIRRNLRPGAVGLIEVPCLEKALSDLRYYDFFTDHVNYFSRPTLELATRLNGFEVIESFPDMFDEYNVTLVRAVELPSLAAVQAESARMASELARLVAEASAAKRKVAIWGAGGKGLTVLALARLGNIAALFDSDPFKQGLHTPVSHLLVEKPSAERLADVDTVIVTAMAYHKEIESQLRNQYHFTGTILFLSPQLKHT
jgi:SAM-dependent methyltransferase